MTFDQWCNKYKPIKNAVVNGTNWPHLHDTLIFEAFGADVEFVKAQEPDKIWTFIDYEGDLYVVNGWQLVNRLGYLITSVACEVVAPNTIEILMESEVTQ